MGFSPQEFARGLLKAHNDLRFEAPRFKSLLEAAMKGGHIVYSQDQTGINGKKAAEE